MEDNTTTDAVVDITDISAATDDDLDFAEEAGRLILESTITRFVFEADDEEVQALEIILGAHEDAASALPKLLEVIPRFQDIMNEEMAAFKLRAGEL